MFLFFKWLKGKVAKYQEKYPPTYDCDALQDAYDNAPNLDSS
jgi:hypothetical protein